MKSKIKDSLLFAANFIKNPSRNASIIASSSVASRAMISGIDFSKVHTVVELGPGIGVFTKEILKKSLPGTKMILIEIEDTYAHLLDDKFGDKVIVENESVHNLNKILAKHGIDKVDIIVSGLPYSIKGFRENILTQIKGHTDRGATFRFFTYTPPLMKKIYKGLPIRKIAFVLKNIPPLWVYGVN